MTAVSLAVVLALTARAEALVKDLGSPAFRDREAAQAELLTLGTPALAAVSKAVASSDPEVGRRAKGLVRDIGFRLDCRRLLAGTPVQLDFTNAPLPAVLTALSKQSGYAVGVSTTGTDPEKVTVTVRTGEVPFWKAVEEVGKAAGLTVAGPGGDGGSVRYYVPGTEVVPQTAGDKIRAWAAEVEALARAGTLLDQQAQGVLEVYRNDLRHYANGAAAIEKAMAEGKADRNAPAAIDRFAVQAENIHKAARNLFTAAGVRAPVGPNGRYPVVLGPAAGASGSAHAGVWVEPATTPPNVPQLAKSYASPDGRVFAAAGPTVYLRVVPEPKLDWVRATGIRVEHATDERDRAVMPNLLSVPFNYNQNEDVIFLGGGVIRKSYNVGPQVRLNPHYASVVLKSDGWVPTTLHEFRGALQGVVKTAPEEVAAVALTVEPKFGPNRPPAGAERARQNLAKLGRDPAPPGSGKPTLTATVRQESVDYSLDVTLQFSGDAYSPVGGTTLGRSYRTTQQLQAVQGRAVVVVEQYGPSGSPGTKAESVYGLRVTDAAGRAFPLSGGPDLTRMNADGTGPVTVHLTLTATTTEAPQGPPVRIAWHATRLAPIEVPFELKDVPVVK